MKGETFDGQDKEGSLQGENVLGHVTYQRDRDIFVILRGVTNSGQCDKERTNKAFVVLEGSSLRCDALHGNKV